MTIHFHFGRIPITITIAKGDDRARELEEKTEALVELALMLPSESARARYVLRKYAGTTR